MDKEQRLILLDFKDYLYMRENYLPSNIKWENIKYKPIYESKSLYDLCWHLDENHNPSFEPSLTTLKIVKEFLIKKELL